MRREIEADFIIFGFGKLTSKLINSLSSSAKKVICISNIAKTMNPESKIQFFTRDEIKSKIINAHNAVFAWNDYSPFRDVLLMNWIGSNKLNLNRSFLLSSSSVYKDSLKILNESEENLESSLLSNEKYIIEMKLTEILGNKGVNHSNLRISNVYGHGLSYGFIAELISSIQTTASPTIFRQRDILRDYLSINDLIYAIKGLAKLPYTEKNINISTGVGVTFNEILSIFREKGYNFDLRIDIDAPIQIKKSVVLDCALLRSKLHWGPVPVDRGIGELLNEMKLNKN